ncbi:MAG: NFACT family protein [Firmicutes bacterium]|nr:NFACT family protein [Bacillota bacterium]
MAFDGIAVSSIVSELKNALLGGRIDKIYQPLKDEIIFSVRANGTGKKVLLSANPSHPRIHFTQIQKDNPMTAPMFCMVLRKHIAGSKITNIYQPDFERMVVIEAEGLNEMGDMCAKKLIIEIMGKHSNIILVDENGRILDSIKRISHDTSSVREVLPGKEYSLPPSQGKLNPLEADFDTFKKLAEEKTGLKTVQFIYQNYTGISPASASEIAYRAGIDASARIEELTEKDIENLFSSFTAVFSDIKNEKYSPQIIYQSETGKIVDFSVIDMTQYGGYTFKNFEDVSTLFENFYHERDKAYHIAQKAHDMHRIVLSNIERCVKKKEIQIKTEADTKDMDIWKLKGELITANIYAVEKDAKVLKAINYYEEDMPVIEIALDPTLSPAENAQRYYNKYNKAKRTLAALEVQKKQNDEELAYLESVLTAIEMCTDDADLKDIRDELTEEGFMKKKYTKGKAPRTKKSKPMHFVSSDGIDIYVGKSNLQNDELTLRFAQSTNIWLHTKNTPGSHVIIVVNGLDELPDNTLLEAANLAAYYSKAKDGTLVAVDYALRKFVRKPNGAKPGMVIYDHNYSVYITPDEEKAKNMTVAE